MAAVALAAVSQGRVRQNFFLLPSRNRCLRLFSMDKGKSFVILSS